LPVQVLKLFTVNLTEVGKREFAEKLMLNRITLHKLGCKNQVAHEMKTEWGGLDEHFLG